jgi:hypothetical protein
MLSFGLIARALTLGACHAMFADVRWKQNSSNFPICNQRIILML